MLSSLAWYDRRRQVEGSIPTAKATAELLRTLITRGNDILMLQPSSQTSEIGAYSCRQPSHLVWDSSSADSLNAPPAFSAHIITIPFCDGILC